MTVMAWVATLLLALVFVLLQAFFSGSETGTYVVNRLRLRLRAEAGRADAIRLLHLLEDHRGLLTTTLVGTNLAVFATSALVTRLLATRFENAAFMTALTLSPFLFVFAEVVPKNVFRRHADVLLYQVSGPLHLAKTIFTPVVWILKAVTSVWGPVGGDRDASGDPLRSRERLLSLLMTGAEEGLLTRYQHDVAGNILRVASLPVGRAMVPMQKVVTLQEPIAPEGVIETLTRAGHSRYPVVAADGAITTLLDVTEYLYAWRAGQATDAACRPPVVLPSGMPVSRALETLQVARDPMGLVVDERGRPVGLVTVKDLVEEIVGDLGEW